MYITQLFHVIFERKQQFVSEGVERAPKMDSEDQEKRATTNCGKFYLKLLPGVI